MINCETTQHSVLTFHHRFLLPFVMLAMAIENYT